MKRVFVIGINSRQSAEFSKSELQKLRDLCGHEPQILLCPSKSSDEHDAFCSQLVEDLDILFMSATNPPSFIPSNEALERIPHYASRPPGGGLRKVSAVIGLTYSFDVPQAARLVA